MAQSQTSRAAATIESVGPQVLPFHKDVVGVLATAARAESTMKARLAALLTSRYGECMPTHDQYRADQAVLAALAEKRGLASDQWVRKPYAAAVRAVFGALPVSMSQESQAKAASRRNPAQQRAFDHVLADAQHKDKPAHVRHALAAEAASKIGKDGTTPPASNDDGGKAGSNAGAPAGQTQQHPVSAEEAIEQLVARVGVFPLLQAVAKVLAADKSTELQAKTITAVDNQLRKILKPAKAA